MKLCFELLPDGPTFFQKGPRRLGLGDSCASAECGDGDGDGDTLSERAEERERMRKKGVCEALPRARRTVCRRTHLLEGASKEESLVEGRWVLAGSDSNSG